ncbi:MAG TPA: asparaginase [Firmicutes bacterium]|nr:asparaginase [Bacillota bacterium]
MSEVAVHVVRGGLVESRHHLSLAICTPSGELLASCGNPERLTFWRSAAKPVQLLPLVAAGGAEHFGFTAHELAVMAGSHSGEKPHVEAVQSILRKIGLDQEHLRCGIHTPSSRAAAEELARSGRAPSQLHCNCSGKHAAMLALAVLKGWPTAGYIEMNHPVQQEMLAVVAAVTGVPAEVIPVAVDGCGVVTFMISLRAMAQAYARLATGEELPRAPGWREAAARVSEAMRTHPHMVAGTGQLVTSLMAATGGRLVVKSGAEGLICVGLPERAWGLALRIEDGSSRAVGPAVIELLRRLGAVSDEEAGSLADWHRPEIRNFSGRVVGLIEAVFPEPLAAALARLRAGL